MVQVLSELVRVLSLTYCSVHSTWAFKAGRLWDNHCKQQPWNSISTDFDIADKLYFEPLTPEDVENIVELVKSRTEQLSSSVDRQLLSLPRALMKMGVPILGTKCRGCRCCRRQRVVWRDSWKVWYSKTEGDTLYLPQKKQLKSLHMSLGYPVLVRPSYVLGGQGMQIAVSDEDVVEFMNIINRIAQDAPDSC